MTPSQWRESSQERLPHSFIRVGEKRARSVPCLWRTGREVVHAALVVSPFAGDELAVPSEKRVRRDDRRDLTQGLTAQPVGSRGKLPPVVISESEAPPTQLPTQDPILL